MIDSHLIECYRRLQVSRRALEHEVHAVLYSTTPKLEHLRALYMAVADARAAFRIAVLSADL